MGIFISVVDELGGLADISKRLANLEQRVEALERKVNAVFQTPPVERGNLPALPFNELLKLPDSMRKTLMAVEELKEAEATMVAKHTGRTRGIETIYLNQLTRMGYLTKFKRGRKIFYKIARYY